MKKILFLFTIALMGASCTKFLEEDPKGDLQDGELKSVADIEHVITAVELAAANFYYDGCSYNMSVRSDDMTACNTGGMGMEQCTVPSSEQYLYAHWKNAYGIIRETNAFFQSLSSITTTSEKDSILLNSLTGYAYFYKGWGYSLIAKWFKQGPIVDTVGGNLDCKSKSQRRLLEYSVEQLKKAEELLPENWKGHAFEKEAPMKITAKAALAEMYLFMAGYPYNGGEEYYKKAAAKAKEVINSAEARGVGFDEYENMWNTGNPMNNVNKERLLSIYYTDYSRLTASTQCFFPSDYNGWDWIMGEKTFFRKFPEGPRKEITFMMKRQKKDSTWVDWDDASLNITQPVYLKKILNPETDFEYPINRPGSEWINSYLMMPLRYTQTALTYAEAVTRANGTPDELAKNLMHSIRERAELADYSGTLTGLAYADSVVQERAWEMAAEWTRWNDICRLKLFKKVFDERATDELNASSGLGTPSDDSYFLDIPPSELALNPNLAQVED